MNIITKFLSKPSTRLFENGTWKITACCIITTFALIFVYHTGSKLKIPSGAWREKMIFNVTRYGSHPASSTPTRQQTTRKPTTSSKLNSFVYKQELSYSQIDDKLIVTQNSSQFIQSRKKQTPQAVKMTPAPTEEASEDICAQVFSSDVRVNFTLFLDSYRSCMKEMVTEIMDGRRQGRPLPPDLPSPAAAGAIKHDFEGQLLSPRLLLLPSAVRQVAALQGCQRPAVQLTGAPTYEQIVTLPENHLAYCRHAKAATHTMITYLSELRRRYIGSPPLDETHLHRDLFNVLSSAAELTKKELTENYFVVTVVRHPLRRLMSAYCDKIVENNYFKPFVNSMIKFRNMPVRDIINEKLPKYGNASLLWVGRKKAPFGVALQNVQQKYKKTNESLEVSSETTLQNDPGFNNNKSTNFNIFPFPTFREFALYASVEILKCFGSPVCLDDVDVHVRVQVVRFNPCALNFDMVLKVESLDHDLMLLKRLLRLPEVQGGTRSSENLTEEPESITVTTEEHDVDDSKHRQSRASRGSAGDSSDDGLRHTEGRADGVHSLPVTGGDRGRDFVRPHRAAASYEEGGDGAGVGTKEGGTADGVRRPRENKSQSKRKRRSTEVKAAKAQCLSYDEYIRQLTREELDLVYSAYYYDFMLYNYELLK